MRGKELEAQLDAIEQVERDETGRRRPRDERLPIRHEVKALAKGIASRHAEQDIRPSPCHRFGGVALSWHVRNCRVEVLVTPLDWTGS